VATNGFVGLVIDRPPEACPGRSADTTKPGKIRGPQMGRIHRPLTIAVGEAKLRVVYENARMRMKASRICVSNRNCTTSHPPPLPWGRTRFWSKIKQFRTIAARYDKLAQNLLATVPWSLVSFCSEGAP
jgi:hypothetical protein